MLRLLIISILSFSTCYGAYNHPGAGSFIEVGRVRNKSPYGYKVYSFYGVPKFSSEAIDIESTKVDANLFKFRDLTIGPVISYNFTPYSGEESELISGMSRKAFFDYGIMMEQGIGFGQLSLTFTRTTHEGPGYISKFSYATGVPLLPLGSNHIWLNILLEYSFYSQKVAHYLFGVNAHEQKSERPAYKVSKTKSLSQIYGLWTPIYGGFWFNLTYRLERFDDNILASPIVVKRNDQSILAGLMYAF
jgi:outer membrane scaffolding protein for murein synthesis (MipA/OmpV family)